MTDNNLETHIIKHPYWWTVNELTNEYKCSDLLLDISGLNHSYYNRNDFMSMINPIQKNKVYNEIQNLYEYGDFEADFQIMTTSGYAWVHSTVAGSVMDDDAGARIILGYIEFLDTEAVKESNYNQERARANELLDRYSSISTLLMEMLHVSDSTVVVNNVLECILHEFHADRVYICEYDIVNRLQKQLYETVRDKKNVCERYWFTDSSMDSTAWLTSKLYERSEIITYCNLNELSGDAHVEYELFKSCGVQSAMIVPLVTKNGIGGYMGIEMVNRQYFWSDADILWFKSMVNIISLCTELKKSEEYALKERAYYQNLYENMPMGFVRMKIIYDSLRKPIDYLILESNSALSMFGVTDVNSILSQFGSKYVKDHDTLQNQLDTFEKVCANDIVFKNRMLIPATNRIADYSIYRADVDEVIALIQDNTESEEISRALHRSEETLENIYNNIPVGVEIYDKDGLLIYMNDIEQEIFGLPSKEDALGVNLFENPNIPKYFLDDLKAKRPSWCDFYYDFDKVNGYYKTNRIGKRHVVLKGSVLCDINNNVENYLLIILDNTDSLKANHKILEFELLFNSIAELSEIGLSQWNPNENILFGTEQWYENLSVEKSSISDMVDAYRYVHPDDVKQMNVNIKKMLAREISSCRQELRVCKDGEECRWLSSTYKVAESSSEKISMEIVGFNIDITELKLTEKKLIEAKQKAEQSDRLKSAFLANMSHEIRTPLNSIVGFSDLLVVTDDIEEREQYIKIIRQSNDLLLQLISDILDLSRIESGSVDIISEDVSLNDICNEITCSMARKLQPGVRLIFENNHQNDTIIVSDRKRLYQVFINLVGNASKFTSEGEIIIGYTIDGNFAKLYVRDTGIGISKDDVNNVFNRFVKLNDFIPGTGLGLSICKSLIDNMGGRIWLESEAGEGTCFYFTQPLKNPDTVKYIRDNTDSVCSETPQENHTPVQTMDPIIEKPVILIAEDTDSNYLLVSTILRRNYQLVRAFNGKEAVELFKQHKPALILMDVKMPVMDGLEATRIIKSIDPKIPLVIITAFAYSEDKQRFSALGADDCMSKPINHVQLIEVVDKYIAKR